MEDDAFASYSPLGVSTPPLEPHGQQINHSNGSPAAIVSIQSPVAVKSSLLAPQLQSGSHHVNLFNTPGSIAGRSYVSQVASNISIITVSTKFRTDTSILLSKCDGFINICKCFTGASLFAIPWAFKQSGMLCGGISLLFIAFLTYYTLYWLAQCGHLHSNIEYPTYPDIAYMAFGKIGFYISWIAILFMTIGVCSSYLVFIGSQLDALFNWNGLTQNIIILIIGFPMILLSLFRSYRFLVPFNILGLISLIFAVVIVFIEASLSLNIKDNSNTDYYYNSDIGDYPLFLGNAAFAFLIHSVILPIEESMRDRTKQKISRDYMVALNYAIIFVTVLFLFFAEYVYLSYDNKTCGNIMDNLNSNKWYTKLVIMSLCINLFFTYPLFLFPMIECLEITVFKININQYHQQNQRDRKIEIKRNILRIILVLITCGIAIIIPDFEKLTGLTGAFGNNVLGLILPPIMYFKLIKLKNNNQINKTKQIKIKLIDKIIGYFSTVFGILILIICTYSFIYSIIFDSNQQCD